MAHAMRRFVPRVRPSLPGRWRYVRRRAISAVAAAFVVAALIAADRAGFFGRKPSPDLLKYDGQVFYVVKIVDGDTIDVDVPDGDSSRTRVRLWGVDTPETVKPGAPVEHFGPQAARFTQDACGGKGVELRLEPHSTRDKYARLLAYVVLPDGRMLNRELVAEGYGYADPRFEHSRKTEFLKLQDQARRAGRGLWKDATDSDLPSYYRGKLALQPAGVSP